MLRRWVRSIGTRWEHRIGRRWGGYAGTSLIAFGALKSNVTLTRTTTATYWGL